ncbi:MAG: TlpA family protein disulfide reductase [Acidobacteria bacterium]|nr:TlpA family protein disulfide reductase [Acidobacteriota bacterium]
MKRLWVFAILMVGAGLAVFLNLGLSQVAAQRRQAPPAARTTTPPTPTPQPSTAGIPIYESSASSSHSSSSTKSTAPTKPVNGQRRQLSPLDQLRVGGFNLVALDGTEVPIEKLLMAGHPTLIQFWQTRCEQSHAQIAYMNDVAERYRQRGLVMLALTIDNPLQRREVGAFVRQERMNYPVYFAPSNLYRLMSGGATGTPQTYIFSREGRIASRLIGWEPKRGRPALEAALEATY